MLMFTKICRSIINFIDRFKLSKWKLYFIDHQEKKNRFNWSLRRNHLRKSIFLIAGNFQKKIIDNYIRVKVWVAIFSIILNRTDWSNVVTELWAISGLLDVIRIIRRFYYFVFLSLPPENSFRRVKRWHQAGVCLLPSHPWLFGCGRKSYFMRELTTPI